jgi:hypothetical protein
MVTKTPMELAEMQDLIDKGELPKSAIKDHFEAEARNVFGADAKKKGKMYIEQGIGSPGNQTRNSIEAYRKHGKGEADYEANLARMEQELKDSNDERRRKLDAA